VSRIIFLIVPDAHLLDLAGPAQVFSTAAQLGFQYRLAYVAEHPDVLTAQGLNIRAELDRPELAADDIIVIPGWRGPTLAGAGALGEESLRWLRAHHAKGGTVASVCAGADALGRAGLLDGRRCTTHHDMQDELARRYPMAVVVRDVLYVVDDRIVSSAGIASGIDLALHLVAARHGPSVAARIAREMVVYTRRNGDEQQNSAMLRYRSHLNDAVHRIQDLIDARFVERLPLAELARVSGCSERTVTRLFRHETGLTPLRYQQTLRLERAEHLISLGATVETAARAVGFADARMLRRLRARPLSDISAAAV
jgi:transcriptional regulator GlxA family with amidase domain